MQLRSSYIVLIFLHTDPAISRQIQTDPALAKNSSSQSQS